MLYPKSKLALSLTNKFIQLPLARRYLVTMIPTLNAFSQKIHPADNPSTPIHACNLLMEGEVIALPTDTVYGLACDANNEHAIQNLYRIKGRDFNKPVAICVRDINEFRRYGLADHISDALLDRLLPGPLTIVIERSRELSNRFLNPTTSKIGIRIPDFRFIQQLCSLYDGPLALTSANRSAEQSSLNVYEFVNLWPQLGVVVDAGQVGLTEECRSASTVIDLSTPSKYQILRTGVALNSTLEIMEEFCIKPVHS